VASRTRRHLFWDYGHPTQRGAELIVSALYDGPEQFTTPVNFKQLVRA
jgi:lysophospholipase L1-like esterase